jgi:hypothetical protein
VKILKREEIEKILSEILEREYEVYNTPTEEEWQDLSNEIKIEFNNDFKYFIELMSYWSFPGDIYNVTNKNNNGNDTIKLVYQHELKNGKWDINMVPFYGIGNGDYFCLNRIDNRIYYYFSDKEKFEMYCDSFEIWLRELKNFLD